MKQFYYLDLTQYGTCYVLQQKNKIIIIKNTTDREGIHVIYLQGNAKALSSLTCTS